MNVLENVRKDIHTHIRLIAMLLIVCTLAFMPAALANGGEAKPPKYATVMVSTSKVDIDAVVKAFYGERASELKLNRETVKENGKQVENASGSLPDMKNAFSYFDGCISICRPYDKPHGHRNDGEGKYTRDEAVKLARNFMHDNLGIAKDGIALLKVTPEDASRKRSHSYQIEFAYALNGIPLVGELSMKNSILTPYIYVRVTDEGIVELTGNLLKLSGDSKGGTELVSIEKVKEMHSDRLAIALAVRMELCYKVGPAAEGRLAWAVLIDKYDSARDTKVYCDAYTGELLT